MTDAGGEFVASQLIKTDPADVEDIRNLETSKENHEHEKDELHETNHTNLSKRALKRLQKREKWLAKLPEKRAKEREKMKLKRQAARENNEYIPSRKALKESMMSTSNCKVRVAIDLDFDDLMNARDLGKCVKQLMRCYTLNRRAANPMQLYFTSFNGKSEKEMSKNNGYNNWDVHFENKTYTDAFSQDDIVYLSSESDNMVTTLDDTKVYIIGGLVDHNAHKGLCHRLAEEKQVAHAQLPISEFLELKSRKVLTIDHVFEILLGVSEGLSWKEAFLKVLPQRKGAVIKVESGETIVTGLGETIDKSSDEDYDKAQNSASNDILEENLLASKDEESISKIVTDNSVRA